MTQAKLGAIVRCPQCSTPNRIPFSKLGGSGGAGGRGGVCGKCKASLPAPDQPITIASEAALDALLRDSPIPVLVDWWSPRCGPCLTMAPALDEVARRRAGDFVVAKVDTTRLPRLGARARIRAVPTLSVHRAGREITRSSGARPAHAIEALVDHA